MKRIKLKAVNRVTTAQKTWKPGSIFDLPLDEAKGVIEAGAAKPYTEPDPKDVIFDDPQPAKALEPVKVVTAKVTKPAKEQPKAPPPAPAKEPDKGSAAKEQPKAKEGKKPQKGK